MFFVEAHPAQRRMDLLSNIGREAARATTIPVVQVRQREACARRPRADEAMPAAVNHPAPVRATA